MKAKGGFKSELSNARRNLSK